jgi:aryl-alcohol dehydrogenase-like predicted oxidoreductase
MEQRKLGRHGPTLSVVGIGTWAIGGDNWDYGWGPQDDEDSLRAIQAAFDMGVNWVDTAPVYGFGHAEEVVGRAIAQHVKAVAHDLGCSQAQVAVAWTLAHPAVTSAIVGFRNGDEPVDLLKAMPERLEPATVAALRTGQA